MKNPVPWQIALSTYLAGLGTVGFWPTPVDKPIHGALTAALKYLHARGVPGWVDYRLIEASANVAMFIPFGVLAAMALPNRAWWQLIGVGLMASICMELGQLLFISARFASPVDVVTNTVGASLGIIGARLLARSNAPRLADSQALPRGQNS